jgi:hypothetical protein
MSSTIRAWHDIVKTRDLDGLKSLLADDVVFFSPVAHTPRLGKAITFEYLSAAFSVLFNESFRYVREFTCPHEAVLEFEVAIDGISVNGVDMIKWNENGKITEFKVLIRPLKAINLIRTRMSEILNFERIEAGSPNAHERLQAWRRDHPDGFLVNLSVKGDSFLHRAEYCPHLGDANWVEDQLPGWGSMGNSTKVVSTDKEALVNWAHRNQIKLIRCSSCAP